MNKYKITSAVLASSLLITPINYVFQNNNVVKAAETKRTESFEFEVDLSKIDVDKELFNAKILLDTQQITQEEYDIIFMILKPKTAFDQYSRSAYYPEKKVSYINYKGVKYMYEHGLQTASLTETVASIAAGAIPGAGWGVGMMNLAVKFGGKSALEKAVNSAYQKKKGISVYYKIHKGITSLNKIRFVVS